ncbi:MAG: hypothetical protein ACI83P_002370 [Janthinobacterium sp.]|jgi:hypothetical protein
MDNPRPWPGASSFCTRSARVGGVLCCARTIDGKDDSIIAGNAAKPAGAIMEAQLASFQHRLVAGAMRENIGYQNAALA